MLNNVVLLLYTNDWDILNDTVGKKLREEACQMVYMHSGTLSKLIITLLRTVCKTAALMYKLIIFENSSKACQVASTHMLLMVNPGRRSGSRFPDIGLRLPERSVQVLQRSCSESRSLKRIRTLGTRYCHSKHASIQPTDHAFTSLSAYSTFQHGTCRCPS